MILELSIQNLAVIQDSSLDLDSSYVALLGETGAGKSLVVDSLSLLQGQKADRSLIRNGEKEARVSAVFSFTGTEKERLPFLRENLDEEGHLVLRRVLSQSGTSKCYVNGSLVSLKELREIGMPLIDIHSQGENSAIADDAKALFFVDAYRKDRILPLRQAYEESYRLLSDLKQGYASFRKEHEELDGEYLRFQIQEIERYHLKENEIEDLEKESQDLKGLERLQEAFSRLQETGSLAEGNLLDLLSSYLSQLRPLTGTSLAESAERASSAGRDFLSAMADLKEEYESLDADPQRIDDINQRLFSLKGLQRKYGKTTSEILDRLADYRKKLEGLEDFDAECQRREKAIARQEAECQKKAEALSEERKKSGEALSKAIGSEMADLGLLRDGFLVRFQKMELGPSGNDQATFFVRLNKGLPECELRKAASGGESSRLMLALKSVLNRLSPAPVLVLDEIDTGVSGKAAGLMARKIRSLSQDSQVIVISHLAQVVASSQDAIEVKKSMKGEKTTVLAKRLTPDEKAEAIARMISGSEVTEAALQQAKALVKEYR